MNTSNSKYFDTLRAHIHALGSPKTVKKDSDGQYQPSTDKNGNGSATLRFLPALPNEESPFVQLLNHAFQEKGWFVANCPTTLNLPCPVCESNAALGNTARSHRKCKKYYFSNVLVVSDPNQPENEGKVFLYKYAATIFDKIILAVDPASPDTEPIDPFDAQKGANFRLRVERNGNFTDYRSSAFDAPSPIGNDDEIGRVLSHRRSLAEIVAPHQFKSYEELKRKFDEFLGAAKAA